MKIDGNELAIEQNVTTAPASRPALTTATALSA